MKTDLWSYLKNTDKPIVLYGMGNGADRVIDEAERLNMKISGVFASDDFVRGQSFRNFSVKKYSDLEQIYNEMIILVCFGTQRKEVIENISSLSKKQELYSVDVPVYGEGVFNYEYAKAHKSEIEQVYNMLADEKSKQVYENIINFKLSGKIDYLFGCQTSSAEAYENILKLGDDETFADLGAFTGDTVNEFLSNVNSYKKIYVIEPDKRSFKRLTENTQTIENIALFNVGVSDCDEEMTFNMQGGRNSAVSSKGKAIQMNRLDTVLDGNEASFIKFDVEGQEIKAIMGSENTIKQYKPKMLISAYHRVDDIFTIPLEIKKIRDDYNVYIRHYEYVPAWDTNFYFV